MTPFIEQLEKNCKDFPDRLALTLNAEERVTYGELWNLSGKIYAYLKNKNIGREDFVLINLPRGPKIVIANIGIWRAGAAVTITEKGYPAERVAHIKKDCNAKIVIDENIYNEMLQCETLDGYEKVNPHDACFAVYTSGSTGNPKGALHEFGKIETFVRCYNENEAGVKKFAAIVPLNFVVYFIRMLHEFYIGTSFYILSYDLIKNISAMSDFIIKEQIDDIFMTPSMLKLYKKLPPTLKTILIGGEASSEIYVQTPKIFNGYSTSEVGFLLSRFPIDKPYKITPVGKNLGGVEILILDEDGQKLPDGEQGEICVENDFFRGYINLPEQTAAVFQNGIYHTGDIGYKNENGDLIISGRRDEMIKINGNRIEPAEIETVAKEILNVKNLVAKGFSGENSFVVLYGLTSEIGNKFDEENIAALREKLSKRLPQYMIPTYYLTLEKFPLNANGKTSRKLFPVPYAKKDSAEYVPPVTETEKIICQKMAEVLGVEKISRNADFYQMGGNSLKTILLVTECDALAIQSSDVYKYRTPEKLAAFCDENKNRDTHKTFPAAQIFKEKIFPAINDAYQNYLQTGKIRSCYSSFFALNEDTMKKISMSITQEFTLHEEVDAARLQSAVDKAVEVCPYITFDISKIDGIVYFQKSNLPLAVHKAGTIEEFGTAENNYHYAAVGYDDRKIIFNVSHILTDGFGVSCFIQAVMDFYFGKEKTFYQGADKIDFVADLMAQELPLPDDYEPKSYKVENHFVPPEINSAEDGKTYENVIEISAQKFKDFCNKYNISEQIAVSILLAKAVQTAHPDNDKIISVRGPVNTRILLQVPNTFQNASIPHIFLNIEPRWLQDELPAEALKNLEIDFADQYSYENLAAFTNWTRKFFTIKNPAEKAELAKSYKRQTDIFVSYMGNVLDDDISQNIASFRQKFSASYPLMVYAFTYGDKIILKVIQSFESLAYVENLLKVTEKL